MNTLPFSQRPTDTPRAGHRDDTRPVWHSEAPTLPREGRGRPLSWAAGVLALALLTAGGVWLFRTTTLVGAVREGSLGIESDPAGASVEIDGSLRGTTPLTVALAPGKHAIILTQGGQTQAISATVEQGVHKVHHLKWSTPRATALPAGSVRGRLQVISDPAGATVTVDGVARGISPLSVEDLEPGAHDVVVQHLGRTQRRPVVVDAGSTASLVFANAPAASESGWMAPRATTPLQIFEKGRLIGSTDTERIMLPAGAHDLEFVADALGFRSRRTVTIVAGQTVTAAVALPQATVNLNAVPWATVWIDGKSLGETPIANLLQTIGRHEVVFRHPELGEKRATVIVSLKEPARVAVDMRVR